MFTDRDLSSRDGEDAGDRNMEQRQARALRARVARQRTKANEQRLIQELQATRETVEKLRTEKACMLHRVNLLEGKIQLQSGGLSEPFTQQQDDRNDLGSMARPGCSLSDATDTSQTVNEGGTGLNWSPVTSTEGGTHNTFQTESSSYEYGAFGFTVACFEETSSTSSSAPSFPDTFVSCCPEPTSEEESHALWDPSASSSSSEWRRPKVKMYLLPTQEDPRIEAKRLKAIRAYKKRQEMKKVTSELASAIRDTTEEVNHLMQEREETKGRIEALQKSLMDLNIVKQRSTDPNM